MVHFKRLPKIYFLLDFKNSFFIIITDDDLICVPNFIKFDHRVLRVSMFQFPVQKIVSNKIKDFTIKQL